MVPFLRCLVLALFLSATAAAMPVVNALQNNYSYALPGTPNYGIARGSIFLLYGSGLAAGPLALQGFNPALDRNFGGVSIKINVNGTMTEAIPYYVSATQIAAILPSATPVGDGTITVTYNGQTSAPAPIHVVQSGFGILTLNGIGIGTAAVYNLDYQYVTLTNAANPGQAVIFWGTGVGPDASDETRLISAPHDLAEFPIEFYIGGKLATVLYRGRSGFPGLDQINVVIPQGVSGCYVSAYVKMGGLVSNFTTIPIAVNGRVCSDSNGLPTDDLPALLSRESISAGWLYLGRFTSLLPAAKGFTIPTTSIIDTATASFLRYTPFDYSNYGGGGQASIGSCIVSSYSSDNVFTAPVQKILDAGALTLKLPSGMTKPMMRIEGSSTHALSGSNINPTTPLFIPDDGGTFEFAASGGADVGAFQQTLSVSTPLNWTNQAEINMVNRGQDLDITWTGGQPNSFVWITGVSLTPTTPSIVTAFNCSEAVSAQHFSIPAVVLGSLVPSVDVGFGISTGQLSVANYTNPVRFSAPGLDVGLKGYFTSTGKYVKYE